MSSGLPKNSKQTHFGILNGELPHVRKLKVRQKVA